MDPLPTVPIFETLTRYVSFSPSAKGRETGVWATTEDAAIVSSIAAPAREIEERTEEFCMTQPCRNSPCNLSERTLI
jgi:hypothetical protein